MFQAQSDNLCPSHAGVVQSGSTKLYTGLVYALAMLFVVTFASRPVAADELDDVEMAKSELVAEETVEEETTAAKGDAQKKIARLEAENKRLKSELSKIRNQMRTARRESDRPRGDAGRSRLRRDNAGGPDRSRAKGNADAWRRLQAELSRRGHSRPEFGRGPAFGFGRSGAQARGRGPAFGRDRAQVARRAQSFGRGGRDFAFERRGGRGFGWGQGSGRGFGGFQRGGLARGGRGPAMAHRQGPPHRGRHAGVHGGRPGQNRHFARSFSRQPLPGMHRGHRAQRGHHFAQRGPHHAHRGPQQAHRGPHHAQRGRDHAQRGPDRAGRGPQFAGRGAGRGFGAARGGQPPHRLAQTRGRDGAQLNQKMQSLEKKLDSLFRLIRQSRGQGGASDGPAEQK